jgi:hypothetical protein
VTANRELDVIQVACIATPDGHAVWMAEPDHDRLSAYWNEWRDGLDAERREAMREGNVVGGVVVITMFRADFDAIAPSARAIPKGATHVS